MQAELSALTACAHLSDKARHELSIALQKLENMKLPPKPKVEGEDDEDEEDEVFLRHDMLLESFIPPPLIPTPIPICPGRQYQ